MMVLNAIAPLVLIETQEGKVVLASFVMSAAIMSAIHHAKGFVRSIGTGHFTWFLPLAWLATRLDASGDPMRAWLIALVVVNAPSLVIDVTDRIRYSRGERNITVRG